MQQTVHSSQVIEKLESQGYLGPERLPESREMVAEALTFQRYKGSKEADFLRKMAEKVRHGWPLSRRQRAWLTDIWRRRDYV